MSAGHLVLIGMMGAGKTTVGLRCATRLRREFVDTDHLVEERVESTVAEIFESEGESWFRSLESEAVADVCASTRPLVIACGGGVVLDPENRRTLHDAGVVIWLRAAPSVLGDRVRAPGNVRPLLAPVGGVAATDTLKDIAEAREPLYADIADVQIATDHKTVDQVADAVVDAFEQESA